MKTRKRRQRRERKILEKKRASSWKAKGNCLDCGTKENITKHHKVHKKDGGRDCIWNYERLYRTCHNTQHKGDALNLQIEGNSKLNRGIQI